MRAARARQSRFFRVRGDVDHRHRRYLRELRRGLSVAGATDSSGAEHPKMGEIETKGLTDESERDSEVG